ncbi:MAG: deoxyribonuclease IV [bacterium]
MRFGVHVSISDSGREAVREAARLNCDCIQIFAGNPRQWRGPTLAPEEIASARRDLERLGIHPVVAHLSYLPNIASPRENIYRKSAAALKREMKAAQLWGAPYIVVHLGSHTGSGPEIGIDRIVAALEGAIAEAGNGMRILLENSAGEGYEMGATFPEIRAILDRLGGGDSVGVCFDTCHAFAAGYDLRDEKAVANVLDSFDGDIGLRQLYTVHVNDSMYPLGSRRDRHQHIGEGHIGLRGFEALLNDERLRDMPFILETPRREEGDDLRNITMLRRLAGRTTEGSPNALILKGQKLCRNPG